MAFLWSRHCGYICAIVTLLPLVWGNTQDICNRDPPDTAASRTPGDNGFRIKIVGRPQPERYTPEQVYTIVINGTYPNQRLFGFMLVAVPLNAKDESTAMGTFQHLSSGVTQFADDCPYVVTHTYPHPKAGVEVLWTAPPAGTGCIELRATVIEYNDIWYKDDGALTSVFCEETGTTENHQSPEMIPECCACGTAKYQMTFHGTWSHRTHPKDYPEKRGLLHWSNIVGASHSKHYTIWQYGGYASEGIRQVCEFGYTRILEQEMRQHSRDVRTVVKTPGIWWSDPHGLEQTRWARFSVDKKNHLASMLTMLGPSPDWCIGISAVNLCLPNCTWTGDIEMDLFPWDAGTDDGVTYMSTNKVSDPQQKIHRITNTFPNNDKSPFFGLDPIKPLATLKIRRIHPKVGDPMVCTGTEDSEEFSNRIEDSEDLELDEMEKKKQMLMNEGKCAMSDWTDWSGCSVTCGVGQRFRKRGYLKDNVDEDMCGQPVMQSENCIGIENECEKPDEECAVARWSDWSPCSVTCGKGTRERRRFYFNSDNKETCSRQLQETEICMAKIQDCSVAIAMLNFTAICSLPRHIGRCRSDFTRYYYDAKMAKCLPFSYSGCRGNRNNFMTEQDCHEMCSQVMKESAMEKTKDDRNKDDEIMDQSKEMQDKEIQDDSLITICSLPSVVGPCRARLTRYYFDSDLLTCAPFSYGGCKGNENNFLSEDDCMDKCFMGMKEMMNNRKLQQDKELENKEEQKDRTNSDEKRKHNKLDKDKNKKGDAEKKKKDKKDKDRKHRKHNKATSTSSATDPLLGPRVPCVVTEWSDWSACSATCGSGYKYKRRMVKQEPKNGGKHCPRKLEKRKKCKAPKCKKGTHQQEVGVTMPTRAGSQGEGHHDKEITKESTNGQPEPEPENEAEPEHISEPVSELEPETSSRATMTKGQRRSKPRGKDRNNAKSRNKAKDKKNKDPKVDESDKSKRKENIRPKKPIPHKKTGNRKDQHNQKQQQLRSDGKKQDKKKKKSNRKNKDSEISGRNKTLENDDRIMNETSQGNIEGNSENKTTSLDTIVTQIQTNDTGIRKKDRKSKPKGDELKNGTDSSSRHTGKDDAKKDRAVKKDTPKKNSRRKMNKRKMEQKNKPDQSRQNQTEMELSETGHLRNETKVEVNEKNSKKNNSSEVPKSIIEAVKPKSRKEKGSGKKGHKRQQEKDEENMSDLVTTTSEALINENKKKPSEDSHSKDKTDTNKMGKNDEDIQKPKKQKNDESKKKDSLINKKKSNKDSNSEDKTEMNKMGKDKIDKAKQKPKKHKTDESGKETLSNKNKKKSSEDSHSEDKTAKSKMGEDEIDKDKQKPKKHKTDESSKEDRAKSRRKTKKDEEAKKRVSLLTSTQAPVSNKRRLKIRDCGITGWSHWSHCSVTCGRGFQFKRRIIEFVEKNGGKVCPTKLEMKRRCEMDKCSDERCKMTDWGLWTPCPKTCGSGSIQERTRQVISAPDDDTTLCGARLERRYCTLPPCPNQKPGHKSHRNASCSYKVLDISDYEKLSNRKSSNGRRSGYRNLN